MPAADRRRVGTPMSCRRPGSFQTASPGFTVRVAHLTQDVARPRTRVFTDVFTLNRALNPSPRQRQVPFTTEVLNSRAWGPASPDPHIVARRSLDDAGDDAGADGLIAFPDNEARPLSIAILWSNSTVSSALSPGITMSSPSLSSTVLVTSVVRK
jgi:hypothetical protein